MMPNNLHPTIQEFEGENTDNAKQSLKLNLLYNGKYLRIWGILD